MSYTPLYPRPTRIIEMYPYTAPGEDLKGPMIGYRLVGFTEEFPEFTLGQHTYAEDTVAEGGFHRIYAGTYVVKPVTSLWDHDPKKELLNTLRNYRSAAIVSPVTAVNVSRYMMDSIHWTYMGMDYVNSGGVFKLPVYDSLDNRVQLLDVLEELGFTRDDVTFESPEGTHINFTIKLHSTITDEQKASLTP